MSQRSILLILSFFFFSSRRRHTRLQGDWSSDVCSSDLASVQGPLPPGDPPLPVSMPSMALEDGDSVVVDSVQALTGQYYVAIAGMVNKPGAYPWRQGMTLRDLVLLARGPRIGADLKEAEVARLPEDRSKGQLATTVRVPLDSTYLFERDSLRRYFGPPGVPFPGSGSPEVALKAYDNVLILRQPAFELQRTVQIQGEVTYPGTYAYAGRWAHAA